MENITIRETDRFIEITVDEGYVITNWDGNEILDYTSTTQMICPLGYDYSGYYTITIEQDAEYMELQMVEIEKGA